MADTKVSALPAHTAPLATDYVPIVTAGATKRVTLLTLAMKVYDVRRYGALCNGTTDDSAAVAAAFAAMLNGSGHPDGTLYIPGNCHVHTTIDLDCGYATNPASNSVYGDGGQERFAIVADGLVPQAGIGTVVNLHHGYNVDAHVRFVGGGQAGDVGIYLDALTGTHLEVEGMKFLGTVLMMDGANGVSSARNWTISAQRCGQTLAISDINAFGYIEDIEDIFCVTNSTFENCADITISHLCTYAPATFTDGLLFTECNMLHIGVLEAGDRPSNAIVHIVGGDFGYIGELYLTAYSTTHPIGLMLEDVKSINIGNLKTQRCARGLYVKGGRQILVGQHQSITADLVPLYIDAGTTFTATVIHIAKANYRYCTNEAVIVAAEVTGGRLVIGGEIELENIAGSGSCYTFDSGAAAFHFYAEGLQKVHRNTLAGVWSTPNDGALVHVTGGNIA